jgi:hypothetical protein
VESGKPCLPGPYFRPDTPLPVAAGAAGKVVLPEFASRQDRFASQVPEAL